MDVNQIDRIKTNLAKKDTTELIEIWSTNDREEYTDNAFEIIKQILIERGVDPPQQVVHVPNAMSVTYFLKLIQDEPKVKVNSILVRHRSFN